jgi:hypothetical protein
MYQVKLEGIGKLVCNCDGCTPLTDSLSQNKLKRLFTLNCEFIEYVKTEEAEASESTNDKSSTPSGGKHIESKKDKSSSTSRRKQRTGIGAKKS